MHVLASVPIHVALGADLRFQLYALAVGLARQYVLLSK